MRIAFEGPKHTLVDFDNIQGEMFLYFTVDLILNL